MVKLFFVVLMFFSATNAAAGQCKVKHIENFHDFYTRFSSDKLFSIERTIYPLKNKVWSKSDNIEATLSYTSFDEDQIKPNLFTYLRENNLEYSFKEVTKKEYLIKMYKPDTDWLIHFNFRRTGNCWYLHETEDFSL